jgi:hypothetical protein
MRRLLHVSFALTLLLLCKPLFLQGDDWEVVDSDDRKLSDSWDIGKCKELTFSSLNFTMDAVGGYTFKLVGSNLLNPFDLRMVVQSPRSYTFQTRYI